jgi:hypothetical protein
MWSPNERRIAARACPQLKRELDLTREASSDADSDSTTSGSCGIDSKHMRKAALYARVSTDGQQKEGTIESQLVELRKQVVAAGHELVKEYIDDGYSGRLLDRPGLDELRADAKSDVYDAIHFLDADSITRDVSYQRIIIAELLKRGNQHHFATLPDHERAFFYDNETGFLSKIYTDTRNQLIWRLRFLMTNPIIKQMFCAPKTKLDIGKEMDAGKVILINNSKRLLGDEGAEFFGRFFIALVLAAAEQRSGRRQDEKRPCFFYIDECQTVIAHRFRVFRACQQSRKRQSGIA